jgi:hypothetical protein
MSTWTEGVAETKRITKLESLQLLVSLPHRKQETFLVTAKEIAKCLVDRIETNPSKYTTQIHFIQHNNHSTFKMK